MQPNELKQFIQAAFNNVLENLPLADSVCDKYFSKNYIQYVDGKKLNYDDFILHLKMLQLKMKSIKITFKHIIVEDDKVATLHIVDGIKNDGEEVKVQVNALMQVQEGKIILCDELTHLIQGQASDKDLGSAN